jgi:hypothetical protein
MAFSHILSSEMEPLSVKEKREVIVHNDGFQGMFIFINLDDPRPAALPSAATKKRTLHRGAGVHGEEKEEKTDDSCLKYPPILCVLLSVSKGRENTENKENAKI